MPIPLLLIAGIGALALLKKPSSNSTEILVKDESSSQFMGLPDIDPLEQQGGFDESYDSAFIMARDKVGVPFALLKAHAIRESALDPNAIRIEPSGKASYGLMQILWWTGSSRFKKWGYSDDAIGDGSLLYDPFVNCEIAAHIILENWQSCSSDLRDTINMYNTGVKESKRIAPGAYVNNVVANYVKIIGRSIV